MMDKTKDIKSWLESLVQIMYVLIRLGVPVPRVLCPRPCHLGLEQNGWKIQGTGVHSGGAKQKLDVTLNRCSNRRGPEEVQGQQVWQDNDSRKWGDQDPAG